MVRYLKVTSNNLRVGLTIITANTVSIRIPESPDNPYFLGRHIEHDPRSWDYAVEELPTSQLVDRNWTRYAPILDQGNLHKQRIPGDEDRLHSAVGNAGIGLLGTSPFYFRQPANIRRALRNARTAEMHAIDLYAEATELDSFPETFPPDDIGSSGLAVAKALVAQGAINSYKHAFSLQGMLSALQSGPVLLGINWYESMFTVGTHNRDVIFPVFNLGENTVGGHELVVDGVWIKDQRIRVVNSWGPQWGYNGYFYLTFDQADQLLAEQGDCVCPQI